MYHQKWQVWVDGILVRTTMGGSSAQKMLNKAKVAWPNGSKIEVKAII